MGNTFEREKTSELIRGTQELINNMRKPKRIYSDMEGGMTSKGWDKWLVENNIDHVMTRSHANTAERAIRTFKDLMTRRLEAPGNENENGMIQGLDSLCLCGTTTGW